MPLVTEEKANLLYSSITEYGVMAHDASTRAVQGYLAALNAREAFTSTPQAAKLDRALADWHGMHVDHSV